MADNTKPKIGKRQAKKITKANIGDAFIQNGIAVERPIHLETRTAGSVEYQVVKFLDEDNQAIAAVYGSLRHMASVWMKESAFKAVKDHLPDDAIVEDVSPFRRGFQWAVHIKDMNSSLIPIIVENSVQAALQRLAKTETRRAEDARREQARIEREAKKAETRKNWRTYDADDASISK